ncbi:hypothetical protein EYC80_007656 [Monilinia laxa]|uniref:Uncharacterized protein n=1 Tax=Monilinia laxa TaxID=61186 RepID=A0A5N6JWJ9_MONLA|nr:hypothetical protein EYC80_007656 [Monilinia laxa]
MEGKRLIKQEPISPLFGLEPDTPIPSIERSNSRSLETQVTTEVPRRERIHPRGGLIGSQRHQTSNTQQIPPQLLREPRGSFASYADNLREFLGPLDPIGHEQRRQAIRLSRQQAQDAIHDPTSDASYYESLREFLGPLNPRGQQQQQHISGSSSWPSLVLGTDRFQSVARPRSMQYSSTYQAPGQITPFRRFSGARRGFVRPIDSQPQLQIDPMPIHRSDSAQFHGKNVNRSDPAAYNPLSMALDHDNTLQTSVRAPQHLQQSIQSLSGLSDSDNSPYIQQTDSNLSYVPAQNDVPVPMDKDRFSAPRALMDTATGSSSTTRGSLGTSVPVEKKMSHGRPLGSKTENNNPRRMQIPNLRPILPVPSAGIPSQSSSGTVPSSQQPTKTRSNHETTFRLTRNASLMLNPFSKIVPASIKLVADNGQEWEYKYPGTRRNWKKGPSGKVTVAKLNVWANAILRRRLPNDFPAGPRKRSNSAPSKPKADKWTEWEKGYLESRIMDAIRIKKGNLDEEDWKLVAEAQNEEFLDYKRLPGLPLALLTSRMLTIDNVPAIRGGGFTKTEGQFPERSGPEIQSILYRWPEIQEKIKGEIKKHRGKIPAYLDCDTDLSESEVSSDDENGTVDTYAVGTDRMEFDAEE